ncbi:MAG: sugar ABC transporter permease [Firmicutes bacterium]|nr:sugar ABC transporter permease [Bacillota bacterium]
MGLVILRINNIVLLKHSKLKQLKLKQEKGFQRFIKTLKKEKYLWILVLPGIIWYLIFAYGPMYGLVIAFERYSPARGILGGPWVGFKWFKQFFESQFFWRLIRNTLLLNIYSIIFSFPAPIILAIMLNEIKHGWYKKAAQTISYLPHFISTVIAVGMVVNFLSTDGFINNLISLLGGQRKQFLVMPEWFRTIYIASGIWQSAGWNSIIYLAAISGIDSQLYEAAIVDGATKLNQIWHITIPGILPTIIILLILNLGHILSVGYEKIILLYNPAVYETADVINTYVYRRGVAGGEFSFGTAVGLFQSVINFIMIILANKISRNLSEISLW